MQKVTKDTPGGGAFYKDAPPPVPPPSEDWVDVLIYHLGDFVNRIAPAGGGFADNAVEITRLYCRADVGISPYGCGGPRHAVENRDNF